MIRNVIKITYTTLQVFEMLHRGSFSMKLVLRQRKCRSTNSYPLVGFYTRLHQMENGVNMNVSILSSSLSINGYFVVHTFYKVFLWCDIYQSTICFSSSGMLISVQTPTRLLMLNT